jgi:hypothetical protein
MKDRLKMDVLVVPFKVYESQDYWGGMGAIHSVYSIPYYVCHSLTPTPIFPRHFIALPLPCMQVNTLAQIFPRHVLQFMAQQATVTKSVAQQQPAAQKQARWASPSSSVPSCNADIEAVPSIGSLARSHEMVGDMATTAWQPLHACMATTASHGNHCITWQPLHGNHCMATIHSMATTA